MKTKLVSALIRLYPQAWRTQYGAELADMLQARPLTGTVCADVVLSAMRQRMRASQAPMWAGLGLMLVTMAALVWNAVEPPSGVSERVELLHRPMNSEIVALVLAAIGFWTTMRGGRRPGLAAILVSTIASLPLVVTGLLMLSGIVDPAFSTARELAPTPTALLLSPLFRLPGAWLWGTVGGRIGAAVARRRRRTATA